MNGLPDIEQSQQHIPRMGEEAAMLASSVPLYDLVDDAPDTKRGGVQPDYPISNDESVAYFDQSRARVALPEYQQATNRTAIVVGESALMGALRFIPEETIVVLDSSAAMCNFMGQYVDALREADTREEWGDIMGIFADNDNPSDFALNMAMRSMQQIREWGSTGYEHPLGSEELYREARQLALQKAIIPWRGDITSRRDMRKLGRALEAHDATVTMVNLTNVIAHGRDLADAGDYADRLEALPITPNAPILTTATSGKVHDIPGSMIVEATGPFFGLENLRQHGGRTKGSNRGSVVERKVRRPDEDFSGVGTLLGLLARLAASDGLGQRGFSMGNSGVIVSLSADGSEEISVQELPPHIQSALRDILP